MKKLLYLFAAVLCLSALLLLPAHAASFTEGVYTYTVEDGKATITKVSSASGDVIIPSTLGGYPVTAIDEGAFYWKNYLTTVVIPEGVTSIGEGAFQSCVKMTSVTLPDSLQSIGAFAFYDCSHLSSITIPKNVTSIGEGAFELCAWLKSITVDSANTAYCDVDGILYTKDKTELVSFLYSRNTDNFVIPEGVTSIGARAFAQCFNLRGVTFPASLTAFAEDAFEDSVSLSQFTVAEGNTSFCVVDGALLSFDKTVVYAYPPCSTAASCTLPDGVTTIKANAFSRSTFLASLTLPDTVTTIGARAFYDCPVLTGLTLPAGVTALEAQTFYGCTSLAYVNIPEGVETLSGFLFRDCTSLTEITIPKSVTSIDPDAFYGCSALERYSVDSENTAYVSEDGVLFNKDKTTLLHYPAGKTGAVYNVPASVKEIGYRAFQDNTKLKTVALPRGLTTIGESAFNFCRGLTFINIPEGVTSIGTFAFSACSSLTGIILPSTLTTLENRVFNNCTALTFVTIPPSVTKIANNGGTSAIVNCPNLTIHGCAGSAAEAFAAARNIPFEEIKEPTPAEYFTYTVTNGGATITAIDKSISGALVIPETLGGYPVVKIDGMAAAILPNITSVHIPATVTALGNTVFFNCRNLTSITVDEANTKFSCADGVLFNKDKAVLIVYPAGKAADVYRVPDTVVSISAYGLSLCHSLKSLILPASLQGYGRESLKNNLSLESITVESGNAYYTSVDGILYSKDTSILFICPQGKDLGNYSVPVAVSTVAEEAFLNCAKLRGISFRAGLEYVDPSAFDLCSSLTTVSLPDGTSKIGAGAFSDCTALKSIYIPRSVTTIAANAFNGCTSVSVYGFPGSYAETFAGANNIPFVMIDARKNLTVQVSAGASGSAAPLKDVSGTLIKDGRPVEGGTITIDEASGKLIIPEDIPAGEYTIRFSKDKYVPRDYTIIIGETP